ncbi:hypothetical protein Aduo_008677 [Ancylostoma duodenale]
MDVNAGRQKNDPCAVADKQQALPTVMEQMECSEAGADQVAAREREFGELKVCNTLAKKVKEAEIMVNAEVAKYWRIGDEKREKFEEVARSSTEQLVDQITYLKELCIRSKQERDSFEQIKASLGCETQLDFVQSVEMLVEKAAIIEAIKESTDWPENEIVNRCANLEEETTTLARKNEEIVFLQKQLEARERELEKSRAAQREQASRPQTYVMTFQSGHEWPRTSNAWIQHNSAKSTERKPDPPEKTTGTVVGNHRIETSHYRHREMPKLSATSGRGHFARDCKKPKVDQGRAMGLQSVHLTASQNGSSRELRGDRKVDGKQTSPYGGKCSTEVILFGRVRNALLDTGSEISIMPVAVLNQIRSDGHNVQEFPVDHSKRILDASGNRIKFSSVVEVPIREKGKEDVIVQMHVTKQPGQTLVIGTNALPALRYTLVRNEAEPPTTRDSTEMNVHGKEAEDFGSAKEGDRRSITELNGEKAVVCKRVYIAPGELKWIPLRGTSERPERLLHSELDCIKSGLCSVNEAGISEVPLLNTAMEPIVLKAGAVVGQWEQDECGYTHVIALDVPADMLTFNEPEISMEERRKLLKEYLVRNRGSDLADELELWNVVDEINEVLEDEYDVKDSMHFLHMQFRCDGQSFPSIEGQPGFPLPSCRCSQTIVAGDLIPTLPQPAFDERIECVLDAARVLAIWWGQGSISQKVHYITDRTVFALNPKAVGYAYAFFRTRCNHISIMSAAVPREAKFHHSMIAGWPWDITCIAEYGWRISQELEWSAAEKVIRSDEHGRVAVIIPEVLTRLKHCLSGPKTTFYTYRSFRDIRTTNNILFSNEVGNVVLVLPPREPEDRYCWVQFVAAIDLWLTCGAHVFVVNGPRSNEIYCPSYVTWCRQKPGVMKSGMACLMVGVVEDPLRWWPWPQATEFYRYLRSQLSSMVTLEEVRLPKSAQKTGKPSEARELPGKPAIRDGRVSKRHLKRVEKRKERSLRRATEKALDELG